MNYIYNLGKYVISLKNHFYDNEQTHAVISTNTKTIGVR